MDNGEKYHKGGGISVETGEGEWQMFMGEYSHTIDAKGRIIIPSKFREKLGEEFIITKGLDGCLFGYPKEEWERFADKLQTLPLTDAKARKFARFFLAGAAGCELDKQGRTLIPSVLREHAGLKKEIVLIGVSGRIEIWDRERWNECNTFDDMDEIAEHMTDLGLGI